MTDRAIIAVAALGSWIGLAGCQSGRSPAPATIPAARAATEADRTVKIAATLEDAPPTHPALPAVTPMAPLPVRQFGPVNPPTGHACRVHLRRDVLGLAAPAPLPIGQDTVAARGAQIAGVIDQVTDEWLILRVDGRREWIPRGVILMIEVVDAP